MNGNQPTWCVRAALAAEARQMVSVIHAAYAEYVGWLDPPSGAHAETEASVRHWFTAGGAGVADADGTLIGVVHYDPLPDALYLGRLAVLPAWRSHGIGRALVAFVENEARARGLQRVTLGVRIQLPANHAFYAGLGYSVVTSGSHNGYTNPTFYTMEKIITPAAVDDMMTGE